VTHAFISYKREDEVRVGRIARALEAAGVPLWWDRSLLTGRNWHEDITEHLESAGCVIVIWSEASVGPTGSFVRDEARRGLARGILVPVNIDRVRTLPLGFGEVQSIDLEHWKGNPRDPFFRDLVAAVQATLAQQTPPPPAGPRHRLARRLTFGATSGASLAVVSALALNAFGVTQRICVLPPQPAIADACGALRIGDQPTEAERLAWAALPKGDCQALRGFVREFPESPLRSRAADLITAGERGGPWIATTREVPIYVEASDGAPRLTKAAEQADALQRAKGDADQACRPLAAGTIFRYVPGTASVKVGNWSCVHTGAAYICDFTGWAECQVRRQAELCG
jgi:TIR domain